jgi:hypothetical protein
MLQRPQTILSFTGFHRFISEESPAREDADTGLEDAARTERDYLRQRLREELGREPTESELDEWLRQHTEGY